MSIREKEEGGVSREAGKKGPRVIEEEEQEEEDVERYDDGGFHCPPRKQANLGGATPWCRPREGSAGHAAHGSGISRYYDFFPHSFFFLCSVSFQKK